MRENWRVILISLLAANLVFMGLLELQRRTLWDRQREYLDRIEQIITLADQAPLARGNLTKALADIRISLQEVPTSIQLTKDIQPRLVQFEGANFRATAEILARLRSLEIAVEQRSVAKP